MNENTLMIVLRVIHIIGGVFWVGTAMQIAWFLGPAQKTTGLAGLTFIEEVIVGRKLQVYLPVAMIASILAGLAMYGRLVMITHGQWASTTPAMVLGFGALCGIIGGGIGASVGKRTGTQMVALSQAIKSSGGSMSEQQRSELSALQNKAASEMRIVAALLVLAVAAMASARYL